MWQISAMMSSSFLWLPSLQRKQSRSMMMRKLNQPRMGKLFPSAICRLVDEEHICHGHVTSVYRTLPGSNADFGKVRETTGFSRRAPEKFSVMSWNLDGLDEKNLEKRTDAVISLIKKWEALQEFINFIILSNFISFQRESWRSLLARVDSSHFWFHCEEVRWQLSSYNWYYWSWLPVLHCHFSPSQQSIPWGWLHRPLPRHINGSEAPRHQGKLYRPTLRPDPHLSITSKWNLILNPVIGIHWASQIVLIEHALGEYSRLCRGTEGSAQDLLGSLRLIPTRVQRYLRWRSQSTRQRGNCILHASCATFTGPSQTIFIWQVEGILPAAMADVWTKCGSRETCRYTWDLTRNTNKQVSDWINSITKLSWCDSHLLRTLNFSWSFVISLHACRCHPSFNHGADSIACTSGTPPHQPWRRNFLEWRELRKWKGRSHSRVIIGPSFPFSASLRKHGNLMCPVSNLMQGREWNEMGVGVVLHLDSFVPGIPTGSINTQLNLEPPHIFLHFS